ncbi:MAG: riboflavin synthase [Acidobacteria bacterium]|nr:riboflavin synthase [Acidobacteriota bacterium]
MFTGLIESIGTVAQLVESPAGRLLRVRTDIAGELQRGESIAVSGVCLTVVDHDAESFAADVSPETLRVTSLGTLAIGSRVNLERSLRADARLGGHFVLGHVDATTHVTGFAAQGESWWLELELPPTFAPWVVQKGSIAVDGISLTVAALTDDRLAIQIIPFTREHTTLGDRTTGDRVNLEADIIGKYTARLAELSRGPATR